MNATLTGIATAPVRHLAETGSTNQDCLAIGRAGDRGPLWVRADRQQTGRGRRGRVWESPVGNLYCSLLFPVLANAAVLPQLSQVAAVGLAAAVQAATGGLSSLHIKWPNDLLVSDAKVAGILVESTRTLSGEQLCVIGCGVNCVTFPADLPYPATCLSDAAGHTVEVDALFSALRTSLAEALSLWDSGRGYAEIRKRWLEGALPLDTPLVVRGPQAPISGRFQGIDLKGRLLLLGPEGPVAIEAGEVNLN